MKPWGLVLSGGLSARMGRDKGALIYSRSGLDQRARCFQLLNPFCERVFVSCRESQRPRVTRGLPVIIDAVNGAGPGVGILSAAQAHPGQAWWVLACDFPDLTEPDIEHLTRQRSTAHDATCFRHPDGTLEPLLAIWEPRALQALAEGFQAGRFSPRQALESLDATGKVLGVSPLRARALRNVNGPEDQAARAASAIM